ncbi:MAG: glycosyltransferase [Chryseobacterium sp.]|nr:MAG: glycosyltransferase [Chryseobacterium sp.]
MHQLIVIPCYNESGRLPLDDYIEFLSSSENCSLLFCDDGSKDDTLRLLQHIKNTFPEKVEILPLAQNAGKAEAIRQGVQFAVTSQIGFDSIAYLDADLATSLMECREIMALIDGDILCAFGSRIAKIDSIIERRRFRHYVGRIIATAIYCVLRLRIYDTQCGCKAFARETASTVFKDKFLSRWLFDVEIFYRLILLHGRKKMHELCREVPLKRWRDVSESRVSLAYGFKLWIDLFLFSVKVFFAIHPIN